MRRPVDVKAHFRFLVPSFKAAWGIGCTIAIVFGVKKGFVDTDPHSGAPVLILCSGNFSYAGPLSDYQSS